MEILDDGMVLLDLDLEEDWEEMGRRNLLIKKLQIQIVMLHLRLKELERELAEASNFMTGFGD
jgi:hypothetical protein